MNYYNEWDKFAAAWLRELIAEGLIPKGDVDERSITDVQPGDIRGYTQVHFFAGIAGWPYALQLAGWPDDRPVWTGSCPCPSFSVAGKGSGFDDPRDLWPHMFRLVRECRPEFVFGEQVEAAIGYGWLDRVCADLEAEAYAVGSAVLGAHSAGAPHIRQRLYWMAHAQRAGLKAFRGNGVGSSESAGVCASFTGSNGRLANTEHSQRRTVDGPRQDGRDGSNGGWAEARGEPGTSVQVRGLPHTPLGGFGTDGSASSDAGHAEQRHEDGGLGHANGAGQREQCGTVSVRSKQSAAQHGGYSGCWADSYPLLCRDGKVRRVPTQSEIFPLVARFSNRVGALRGAGNAICPPVAAEFVMAAMEAVA